ncbi:Tryptophan biosynthesis protein TrpCF [Buchnera aphidicola (Eriosoma grossulariae)]|uniref:bifunctional indole-3-glycerol-phosphate synthase TrpC/phosphoribosylanthranilate isomerase TrpF n=1 Tax=Buchnera aphidicola TaxID=9 RepID=UPI0034638791
MKKTFLQKIIINKKIWLDKKKVEEPLLSFKNKITVTNKDFYLALKKNKPAFIFECKKYSPSLGLLNKKFNIKQIANTYKHYASVVSILTDQHYFHGDFQNITQCRSILHQPILCKDFFIDPYQIYLARYYQADAIILMLSVLSDQQYVILSEIAQSMKMGILTEVNNQNEVDRAIYLKAKVIGINNRNLHDLTINLDYTRKLAISIPKNITIISESGISNYNQVRELSDLVNGFLIGSSLMLSNNLEESIKSIMVGKNKICGLTRLQDAQTAEYYGAIYGGLIFFKNSTRYIHDKIAKKIVEQVKLKYIGVFCNEPIININYKINDLQLYGIQLHGSENQEYINNLLKIIPKNTQIWKAFYIDKNIPQYNWKNVNYYLFDNKNGGGTGKTFDWSLLKNSCLKKVLLAGGLNEQNCFNASKIGCVGLDFNSGVEKKPGVKDKEKIKNIFHILRYYK